jgi:hypothetical protein
MFFIHELPFENIDDVSFRLYAWKVLHLADVNKMTFSWKGLLCCREVRSVILTSQYVDR